MKKLKKGFARGKSCAIIVLYVKKRRIKVSVERRFDHRCTESVFCLQTAKQYSAPKSYSVSEPMHFPKDNSPRAFGNHHFYQNIPAKIVELQAFYQLNRFILACGDGGM